MTTASPAFKAPAKVVSTKGALTPYLRLRARRMKRIRNSRRIQAIAA